AGTGGNFGVNIHNAAAVQTSGTGTIGITGTGGDGGNGNIGVEIVGAGTLVSSPGKVTIAGDRTATGGNNNVGVFIAASAIVENTGAVTGNQLVITGGTASSNPGTF